MGIALIVIAVLALIVGLVALYLIRRSRKKAETFNLEADKLKAEYKAEDDYTVQRSLEKQYNTAARNASAYAEGGTASKWVAAISFGTLGLCLLGLVFASVTKVDEGEVGVEVLFGRVTTVHDTSGIIIKNPLSTIVRYPTRTVESTYTGVEDEGEKAGFDAIQAFSAENAEVSVDLTVLWHVDPSKADTVYKTVKDSYREVLIRPITRSATRDCVAEFEFDVARTTARGEVADCILTNMTNQLGERGFQIESVQLRGMRADATLQASIEAKLQAANAVKEAEFRKDQAEVDKQRAIIEAEALAESAVVSAEGKARSTIINAEAEAQKIEIEAEAQADANREIQASLDAEILELLEVEALAEGGNLIVLGGNGTTPLIQLP